MSYEQLRTKIVIPLQLSGRIFHRQSRLICHPCRPCFNASLRVGPVLEDDDHNGKLNQHSIALPCCVLLAIGLLHSGAQFLIQNRTKCFVKDYLQILQGVNKASILVALRSLPFNLFHNGYLR